MDERGKDERPTQEPAEPEGSFLDEVSLATKFVVVVTILTIAGYLVFLIVDPFL